MAGWDKDRRDAFERAFYEYLDECVVNSKDHGPIRLGEHLYDAQRIFFTGVFDGLEAGIHRFNGLKSRQLGISTSTRALSIFWCGMFDGLNGACVFDSDVNKTNARREIEQMITDLPAGLGFPKVKSSNRMSLILQNGSAIQFMSAGVRKGRSGGNLGRSFGLSMLHASELSSWDNEEGAEALEHSLSEINPNRLYILESTARGFNRWHDIWMKGKADSAHTKNIFLGWWSKNSQIIRSTDSDFERYGIDPPSAKEERIMREVYDRYGHKITQEQLAWYRRKIDPNAAEVGNAKAEYEANPYRLQEQPSVEEDSFQLTGSAFFTPEKLTEQVNHNVSKSFKTYMFMSGIEFTDMRVKAAPNSKFVELKVWEEPDPGSVYVVAADPAFGTNVKNDRSAIQVLRCYADGMDQVAEYAWPLIGTRPFAWVILALAGWYAGDDGEVFLIIEQNGPGTAVWDEVAHLKSHIANGYQPQQISEMGLDNIFKNVRNYVYGRPDAMTGGKTFNWTTKQGQGAQSKVRLMERLRDFTDNGMLRIRSMDTLEEMRSITREEDSIAARGSKKDDRAVALALGVRCWEERVRRMLTNGMRTREREAAKKRLSVTDMSKMFHETIMTNFMAGKAAERHMAVRSQSRHNWRYRTR